MMAALLPHPCPSPGGRGVRLPSPLGGGVGGEGATVPVLIGLCLLLAAFPATAQPTPERQRELTRMVRQECGFCHGLRLTGGLGSPITPEAMRDKPDETMAAVIRHGIPGTAMPGWSPFLTEAEAAWIVEQLKKGLKE